jgi:hypothetical protein
MSTPLLSAVTLAGPLDLRDWIVSRMPAGADITGLSLFCTADLPDRVLCLISFRDALAGEVAEALRGQTFGFDSTVISLPVGNQFRCRCRLQGLDLTSRSCSCNPGGTPAPTLLDEYD